MKKRIYFLKKMNRYVCFLIVTIVLAGCVKQEDKSAPVLPSAKETRQDVVEVLGSSEQEESTGNKIETSEIQGSMNAKMPVPLQVEGTRLVDMEGNPVQLRGVSTHGIAWYPEYVNADFFDSLQYAWGASVVRLAMYTAENGGYCTDGDKECLKQLVKDGVKYATDAGLYVIIDWHILQDNNPNMYKEEAKTFFDEMSNEYADYNNVLYEICNEPNGNTSWEEVKQYAEEIIPVIRANDADAVIIVGTPTWCQDVDKAAKDPIKGYDNLMYSLHFYADTHRDWLRNRMQEAIDAGLPIFVTEFGTCDASGNGSINVEESDKWIEMLNKNDVSFVAWNLSNKKETSAIFSWDCPKTFGFMNKDLTHNGQWILKTLSQYENLSTTLPETKNEETNENEQEKEENAVVTYNAGTVMYKVTVSNTWENGSETYYQYNLTIENPDKEDVRGWSVELTFNEDICFSDGWNGEYVVTGDTLTITCKDYNKNIPAGRQINDIGFIISGSEKLALNQ